MIVFIEGNIGAGKSTVLEEIRSRGFTVIAEPVDTWKFFRRRYRNPERWAFTFQIEAIISMANLIKSAPETIVFIERSVQSALMFSEVAYDAGLISKDELDLLEKTASMVQDTSLPSMTVCINVPPSECYKRLTRRQRPGEDVSETYLKLLDKKHASKSPWKYVDGLFPPSTVASFVLSHVEAKLLNAAS